MNLSSESAIKTFLNEIHPLSESTWMEFIPLWELKEYARKEHISAEGKAEHYLYFVVSGIQRGFFDQKDKEHTVFLSFAPSLCGNIESFITRRPANYHVEAITKSMLLRISHNDLMHLKNKNEEINQLMEQLYARLILQMSTRINQIQSLSIEERFIEFTKKWPTLINHIPHKYIASYLAMSDSNFSRLLNTVKI